MPNAPRRLAYTLPTLLLVLVALNQIRLARTTDLTPWSDLLVSLFGS